MKNPKLYTYPDPCLRVDTRAVACFSDDIKEIARAMTEIMYSNQGIGLAATQIGEDLNMAVVDTGSEIITFVNPEIVSSSDDIDMMEEGCLSVPGVCVNIARPVSVEVRACDINGAPFTGKFSGLTAKAIQHEIDHLHGKLIIDYLNPFMRFLSAWKLARKKRTGERL